MPTRDLASSPVTVGTVTATPVARVSVTRFAIGPAAFHKTAARPFRVEVVDASGRNTTVEVRDPQGRLLAAIAGTTLAITLLLRVVASARKKRTH